MRKLVIGELSELRKYVSREFWIIASLLAERHHWDCLDIYEFRRSGDDVLAFLRQRFGELPRVILFRECYEDMLRHIGPLTEAGIRVYVMTEDLHNRQKGMATALRVAHGILSTYAPQLGQFHAEHDSGRVTWVPHAAGPDFLLPVAEHPEPVVFVSGMMSKSYYPLRTQMRRLAERRPQLAKFHHHPGYGWGFNYETDQRVGPGYAAAMQRCLAAFTDASRFYYLVAKHFEIPATGALLIADRSVMPQLAILGYEDGVHYMSVTPDDLENVVEWVLDRRNFAKVDAIRRRGHGLVHEQHTTRERAQQIDGVCA